MRLGRRQRRSFTSLNDLPLTPLIDTALVLLVIFMVTTPVINNSIKLELPKGNIDEAKHINQELVVSVDHRGRLSLNGKQYGKENLIEEVRKRVLNKAHGVVHISGDGNAPYKAVAEIIDMIKYLAGVEHVILETERA
jgi:biopolymer transport protein ExbD